MYTIRRVVIQTIRYSLHHSAFPERRQRMLIVCPRSPGRLVHFLVYRSRATLRVGLLAVEGAMPADSRSGGGVEDGRADEADRPDDHEDDPHRGNPDPVTVRGYRPAHYGTRTD